jgi:hypothetical protein
MRSISNFRTEETQLAKTNRFILSALCFLALFCTVAARAASPFDGTWKTDLTKTHLSDKPLVFYTSQGWYHCVVNCNPDYTIAADSHFHPIDGHAFDSAAVTIVDDHTIAFLAKKGGKTIYEQTRTVSADGNTLTVKSISHPMNTDKAVNFQVVAKRIGKIHPDVHATSGRWLITKESGDNDTVLTTYKVDGDQITMTAPTGESYTATFGGGDAPTKGAYGYDAVSVRKIDKNAFEETDKRQGRVIDVSTMTVSANGKMMTIMDSDKVTGRNSTYVATKQ